MGKSRLRSQKLVASAASEMREHIDKHAAGAVTCYVIALIDTLPSEDRRRVVDSLHALYPREYRNPADQLS